MSSDRHLIELDVLRSIAILIIVFYHLSGSLGFGTYFFVNAYYVFIIVFATQFALSLFFFISGFAIDINNRMMKTSDDVVHFFGKRAKRIYPLYWLSLLPFLVSFLLASALYYMGKLPPTSIPPYFSGVTLLINFIGAQAVLESVVDVNFHLNWFIGVILVYYLIYPFLVILSSNNTKRMIVLSIILLGIFVFALRITTIDPRFFRYYFIFIFGILASRYGFVNKLQSKKNLLVLSLTSVVFTLLYFRLFQNFVVNFVDVSGLAMQTLDILLFDLTIVLWIILSLRLTEFFSRSMKVRSRHLFAYVAFSSYAVFLFHQFYLNFLIRFLTNIVYLGTIGIFVLALVPGIPILILLCFQLQKQMNRLVNRILARMHSLTYVNSPK